MSLEQNLGIRADRLEPQIADMGNQRGLRWTPNFNTRPVYERHEPDRQLSVWDSAT